MDAPSWGFLAALAAAVAALFGLLLGASEIVDRWFTDYREEAARWEPSGVSADGHTLMLEYTTPRCGYDPFDRIERAETASTVTLTVITRYGGSGGCEDIALYHETRVELDRLLGDRHLVDGRTGGAPDFNAPTTGPVRIRQVVDLSRSSYAEGFQSYFRLLDEYGGVILERRLPIPLRTEPSRLVSSLALRVRPGEYRLEIAQRPCERTCASLAPSTDQCSVPVELRTLEPVALRATVRPTVGCTLELG